MKKTLFLTVAAVAVLFASLALNVNNKSVTSSVNLNDLMQSAQADQSVYYWAVSHCADPFGDASYSINQPKWNSVANYDVPFDGNDEHTLYDLCIAGGWNTCASTPFYTFTTYNATDAEGNPIADGTRTGGIFSSWEEFLRSDKPKPVVHDQGTDPNNGSIWKVTENRYRD